MAELLDDEVVTTEEKEERTFPDMNIAQKTFLLDCTDASVDLVVRRTTLLFK
jgi:hypothetical protein